MRQQFFGADASTLWKPSAPGGKLGKSYVHVELDIRDSTGMSHLFKRYGGEIAAVIHTAAQPSHDWAATNPSEDFTIERQWDAQPVGDHAPVLP